MLIDFSALLNNAYSYAGLFILVFASSIVIVPEIELLVASFAAYVINPSGLFYLIMLVLIASVLGDVSIYLVARKFSDKFERWMEKFKWYSKDEKKYKLLINKYGFLLVFLTRFLISGAGIIVNYISGFEKMNRKKFMGAVVLGQTVSVLLYSLAGYVFKDTWTEFINLVQSSLLTIVGFVISAYILYRIVKFYKKRHARVYELV